MIQLGHRPRWPVASLKGSRRGGGRERGHWL